MSEKYRLMIYFVHATINMYKKDITVNEKMTVSQFNEMYPELIQRIYDEGISIFNYELSHNQINTGIQSYIQSTVFPQSVQETNVYIPQIN